MQKSQKEKNAVIAEYTLEQIQRMITGFIPGGHIIDGFWNFRSGLKQKRLLDFSESLKNVIEKELGKELDNYDFETEDFVDLFDSVMSKVQATKSEIKLDAFRAIMVNNIKSTSDSAQVFADLITRLNEVEIELLNTYLKSEQNRKDQVQKMIDLKELHNEKELHKGHLVRQAQNGTIGPDQSILKIEREGELVLRDIMNLRNNYKEWEKKMVQSSFQISQGEFEYYKNNLISNGLLKIDIIEPIEGEEKHPFVFVTDFGKDFVQFITI